MIRLLLLGIQLVLSSDQLKWHQLLILEALNILRNQNEIFRNHMTSEIIEWSIHDTDRQVRCNIGMNKVACSTIILFNLNCYQNQYFMVI